MERKDERIVFDGIRYRVYQWKQELFDGTITTFERVEHISSVTIFAIYKNKFVIQTQIQPHFEKGVICIPGGHMDTGEKALNAAKRELLEEEGLESKDWEYWKKGGAQRSSYSWANHIFIARECMKVAEPDLDAGERIEHLLYTPDEFFALLDDPDFRHQDIIKDLLEIRNDKQKREEFLNVLGIQ